MDNYSRAQEAAVHWLGGATAVVSFCCSSILIVHLSLHPKRKTYHRFLFGLSLFDMMASSNIFVSRFIDLDEPSTACSNIGFVQIVAVGTAVFYNCCLAVLFLLTVKFGTKESTIVKYFEIPSHLCSILGSTVIALLGYFLESINPVSFTSECWLGPHPSGCHGDDCIRGQDWGFILDQISHAIFFFVVIVLVVCNAMIYCKVRKTLGRNNRYDVARKQTRPNVVRRRRLSLESNDRSRDFTVLTGEASSRPIRRRFSMDSIAMRCNPISSAGGSRNSPSKTRQVAIRSFLFCGGFALSYTFSTLIADTEKWVGTAHGTWWFYAFMVLDALFLPLQGFWDSIIYFRPRYIQWRNASHSRWFSLRKTIFSLEKPSAAGGTRSQQFRTSHYPESQHITRDEDQSRFQNNDSSDDFEEISYSNEMQLCDAVSSSIPFGTAAHGPGGGIIG